MRFLLICLAVLTVAAHTSVDKVCGQGFPPRQTDTTQTNQFVPKRTNQFQPNRQSLVQEATFPSRLNTTQTSVSKTAQKKQKPWKLSSRIHLEKGTNQGYLVVQMDLADGYHVYSLSEKGSPSPTKLAVLPSNDLKVTSKFVSAKAPLVIEKDPVFGQRIEKHKGQVQFFAPIQVRVGVDPAKLTQEIQFSGQVCSESACQPIRNLTSSASFAGYFEIPKQNKTAGTGQQQLK